MANAATNTRPARGVAGMLRALADNRLTAWRMRRQFHRTYRELDRLTNRELADIGVRRCDIVDIARTHVYGR